jgi:hypothetical protein
MKFNDAALLNRQPTASFLFSAGHPERVVSERDPMPHRTVRLAAMPVLITLILLSISPSLATADESTMPTKTPFPNDWPTKTSIPPDPATKTLAPIEPPTKPPLSTDQPTLTLAPSATPTAQRRDMHTPRPVAPDSPTPSATPSATRRPTLRSVSGGSLSTPTADGLPVAESTSYPTQLLHQASEIPLRPIPLSNTYAPPTTDLTAPVLGFFGLGLLVWLSLLHQQRTLVNRYHTWARADLRLRRAAEQLTRRTQIIINDDWIVALLNQAGFDAIGHDPGIDQVDRILLDPFPAIVGLGRDFQRVVFTPAPASIAQRLIQRQALINLIGGSPRGIRMYSIDAIQGDVFVTDDLAAAYHYLCQQRQVQRPVPARLARCDRWLIYVIPHRRRPGQTFRP